MCAEDHSGCDAIAMHGLHDHVRRIYRQQIWILASRLGSQLQHCPPSKDVALSRRSGTALRMVMVMEMGTGMVMAICYIRVGCYRG